MWFLLFQKVKDNHCANHVFHQDKQDEVLGKNLLNHHESRLKYFAITQSNISVGRSCIIECPCKLLASKDIMFVAGLLGSYNL